jgi:putative membrane protein
MDFQPHAVPGRRAGLTGGAMLLLSACTPRASSPTAGHLNHMMYYGYGGMLMWLLFLILAGLLIYFVVTQTRKPPAQDGRSPEAPSETPLDILKKRYARGEIDKEEFDRLKRDLDY